MIGPNQPQKLSFYSPNVSMVAGETDYKGFFNFFLLKLYLFYRCNCRILLRSLVNNPLTNSKQIKIER
jgi:hypothetical protein